MKVTVTVEVPESLVEKVYFMVVEQGGKAPTTERLIEFFQQDIELCYEQYSDCGDGTLEDAVESFFYVEEVTE